MAKLTLLFLYVALSLLGLHRLKTASLGLNLEYLVGCLAYGSGFALWLLVLKLYPLSIAFPLAAGSLIIGTQLVGIFLLQEQLSAAKLIGILCMLVGLVALTISDLAEKHD